jgi:hypothetical protein
MKNDKQDYDQFLRNKDEIYMARYDRFLYLRSIITCCDKF